MKRGRRIAFVLSAFVLSVLVSGMIIEIYSRIRSKGFDIIHGYEFKLGKLGMLIPFDYKKLPRNFSSSNASYKAHINKYGLRGELPSDVLTERYHRIYMIGDSTTFGVGVGDAETLPACIQANLVTRTPDEVIILNAGVPGFSTLDQVNMLKRYGKAANPSTVLLMMFSNDLYDITVEPESRIDDFGLVRSLKNFSVSLYNRNILKAPALFYIYYMGLQRHRLHKPIRYDAALAIMEDAMIQAHVYCDEMKAEFIACLLPMPDGSVNPKLKEAFAPMCERSKSKYFDISDSLSFQKGMMFPDDKHYTADGNRLLGKIVADYLIGLEIFNEKQ